MHLGIIKIIYNRTAQPRCYLNAFYGWPFREPRRGGNSDFAMTIWRFWISDCMYVVCAIDCSNAEFCASCVCVRQREREKERQGHSGVSYLNSNVCVCVCVCVCVWERERERERESERVTSQRSVETVRNHLNRGLFANTYEHRHCVCHTTLFPSRAWTDGKTKSSIFDTACGVRPITMHCASWPIRADCACRKEELCRKWSVWERRGKEELKYCTVFEKLCFLNIKADLHIPLHQIHKIMIFDLLFILLYIFYKKVWD